MHSNFQLCLILLMTQISYIAIKIKKYEKNVNLDLSFLFEWLCSNRLSLDVKKNEFIIFRPPRSYLKDRVTLTLNGCKIFESTKDKYLGNS